ncbi:MAG: RNA polymerase sigma factor [Alphaproteobacteria bacterium]|nr:RNA polymerase sigma factor [Alphaproteobacteria bacterium]
MNSNHRELLETWYDRYGDELYRTLCGAVKNTDVPEEIIQETFAKMAVYLSRLGPDQIIHNPRAFLYKVAYNELYTKQRRLKLEQHLGKILGQPAAEPYETVTPEDIALGREELAAVTQLIAKLPKRQRAALTLSRMKNMTHAQIAETLGIQRASVKQHIVRALAALRGAGHG